MVHASGQGQCILFRPPIPYHYTYARDSLPSVALENLNGQEQRGDLYVF